MSHLSEPDYDRQFDYDDEDFPEEDEEETFDCHLGRDGVCGKAGSEECDFECPYRRMQR